MLDIHFHLLDLVAPRLNALDYLFRLRDAVPQVRVVELCVRQPPLEDLRLLVRLRRGDLLFLRLRALLHPLGPIERIGRLGRKLHGILPLGYPPVLAAGDLLQDLLQDLLLLLQLFELRSESLQIRLLRLADRALVIAEDGHLAVGIVVFHDLLRSRQTLPTRGLFRLSQLVLQRLRGVVRTEDLRGQALHDPLEVGVEYRGRQVAEDVVRRLLLLAEAFEVLVHLLSHAVLLGVQRRTEVDRLLEEHRVLAQEFQLYLATVPPLAVGVEFQVLDAKRAASHRVRLLVRVLLPPHSQREAVDDPHRRRELPRLVALRRQVLLVIGPYPVDVAAERGRLVVLAPVALTLEARHRRELHVFVLGVDVLGPLAQPLDGGVVPDLPPGPTGHVAPGRRGALRHVDHDLLGGHALLELPHLRMLSAPSECAGGFHFFRWEVFQ